MSLDAGFADARPASPAAGCPKWQPAILPLPRQWKRAGVRVARKKTFAKNRFAPDSEGAQFRFCDGFVVWFVKARWQPVAAFNVPANRKRHSCQPSRTATRTSSDWTCCKLGEIGLSIIPYTNRTQWIRAFSLATPSLR
jgi:hypothetical protein